MYSLLLSLLGVFFLISSAFSSRFVVDIEYACSESARKFHAKTTLWEDDGLLVFYDLIGYGATYVQGRNKQGTRVEGYDLFDFLGFYFEPYLEIEHDCGGADYEFVSFFYLEPCMILSEECVYNVEIDLSTLEKRRTVPYIEKIKFQS